MAKRRSKTKPKPTLKKATKQAHSTASRLDAKARADAKALQKAITSLEKRMVSEFTQLTTTDLGNLVGPKVNLKKAQHLHKRLVALFEEEYGTVVRSNVAGYGEVTKWIDQNFKELDVAARFTDVDRTMLSQLRKQSIVDFASISTQAQNRITQAMYTMIATGAPMDDLLKEITGALVGHKDARGKPLSSYAELYANDALMNYYNSVHIEKGKQAGLNHFLYVGDVMATSRDFCVKRAMKVYTEEQINSWTHDWAGKRGPAMVYRGGWRCRHTWQAIEPEWMEGFEAEYGKRPGAAGPAEYKRSTPSQIKNQLSGIRIRAKKGKLLVPGSAREAVWFGIPLDERKKIVAGWKAKGIDAPADYLKKTKIAKTTKVKPTPKKAPTTKVSKQLTPPHKVRPPKAADLSMNAEAKSNYNWAIKNLEAKKRHIEKNFPEFIKEKGVKGRAHLTYTPKEVLARTGKKTFKGRRLEIWKSHKQTLGYWDRQVKQMVSDYKNLPTRTWRPVVVKEGDTWIWKRTNNIDEAASQLRQMGMGDVEISLFRNDKKLLEIYNSIGEELAHMRNKFPGIDFTEMGKDSFEWFRVMAGRGEDGITASYYYKVKGLELFGQSASLPRKRFFLGKRRGYFAESGIRGDFRHEFGHHVQMRMNRSKNKFLKKMDKKFQKIYDDLGEDWFSENISGYAGDDILEGFAECFSVYTDPIYGTTKKRLPKILEEYFEELLQGRVVKSVPLAVTKKKALEWVEGFITTSKLSKAPSAEVAEYLRRSVKGKLKAYRGIGAIKKRFTAEQWEELNNLKVGDKTPAFLARPSGISSYTKKKGLAKKYAEGTVEIVVEADIPADAIMGDLEELAKILKAEGRGALDIEDIEYMLADKEVIVQEPIASRIISIKGTK